jgi:SNF2 family DNA or RNA helicase
MGLLWAPGRAKTRTILEGFKRLKDRGEAKRILVITKLRPMQLAWPQEVSKWGFGFKVVMLHGPNKNVLFNSDADVFLMTYDAIPWLVKTVLRNGRVPADMLVMDESSKLKNWNAKTRMKKLKMILRKFSRRYILTGSFRPNNIQDIFAQVYALDEGEALGRFITAFRNTYMEPCGYMGYEYRLQEGASEKIRDKIKHLVHVLDYDYANLPLKTMVRHLVRLPKPAAMVYREMEEQAVVLFSRGHASFAKHAAVVRMKLMQIANGALFVEDFGDTVRKLEAYAMKGFKQHKAPDGRTWVHLHDGKIEALRDIVEELGGEPILVAYKFQHDLQRLQEAFPQGEYIGGKMKLKEVQDVERRWNLGEIPILFGHPASVAHGLNLQEYAWNVAYFGFTDSQEDHEQFFDRVWRTGQKHSVVGHLIVVEKSVDEVIVSAVDKKEGDQRTFNKLLQEEFEKYVASITR